MDTLKKIALVVGIVVAVMGIVWMARGWWADSQPTISSEFYRK